MDPTKIYGERGEYVMYTVRNLKNDLYTICTTHYVKYRLLELWVEQKITEETFIHTLRESKTEHEILEILQALHHIQQKIAQNGGTVDIDPVTQASQLRKSNKLKQAFLTIDHYLKQAPHDEEAYNEFGRIMYASLKTQENNIDRYEKTLHQSMLHINWSTKLNVPLTKTRNSILFSIYRVIQKNENYADRLFPQIFNFCSPNFDWLENDVSFKQNNVSASRLLVKKLAEKLNDQHYIRWTDYIGFRWFRPNDYQSTTFVNKQNETIHVLSTAEKLLNLHSKRLSALSEYNSIKERIREWIPVLNTHIQSHPEFQWIPYHKVKLLIALNEKEKALQSMIEFARTKKREFWVWQTLSELVHTEEEQFYCLCAGLLCAAQPTMIVNVQEKIIPFLLEKKMYAQAKYELDIMIQTRTKHWGKIPAHLKAWQQESWYTTTEAASDRESLKEYAKKTNTILAGTLPSQNIFITHINKKKQVIHFFYENKFKNLKEGYAYVDELPETDLWKQHEIFSVQMSAHPTKPNLHLIHNGQEGDPIFVARFIEKGTGTVRKEKEQSFAFVDEIFISPPLVKKHKLKNLDVISFTKVKNFNKKRGHWGWKVEKIHSVSETSR